jgi:hypothetical protein
MENLLFCIVKFGDKFGELNQARTNKPTRSISSSGNMSLVLCTYSTSFLVQVKVEIIDGAVEFGAGSIASVLKNLHWIHHTELQA